MDKFMATMRTYLPLARPYLPHGAALLVFAMLGLTSGFVQATKTPDNPHLKDSWSLPAWTPYRAGPEKAKLAATEIWDGQKNRAANAKQAAPVVAAWKLVGTVRSGKTYAAIVQVDAKRVQRFAAGDVLPNGEKVIGVKHGALEIDNNGAQQEIKLFQADAKVQPDAQKEKK